MYAQENDNRFPKDLQEPKEYIKDSKILESPRKPKDFDGPSYIYIPGHSSDTENSGKHVIASDSDVKPKGELKGTVLPDILVSDGKNIFMRNMRFSPDDIATRRSQAGGQSHFRGMSASPSFEA